MKRGEFVFWDEEDEALFPLITTELSRAYSMGYSPIELARMLNHRSAGKLYAVMRNAGIIHKMDRKRQPKFDVPQALMTALNKCKLSYLQWCCAHGLDPGAAAIALVRSVDDDDPASLSAHRSFRQDFPTLYAKVYQCIPPDFPGHAPDNDREQQNVTYTVIIEYNQEESTFEAYIPEMSEYRARGKTRDKAYFALKKQYVMRCSILKLRRLPPKEDPWL